MKTLKVLSVMSLGMLSLATAGITMQSQAEPEAVSCHEQSLCGRCGDGYCAKQCGETAQSCPADCGGVAY
jgi:hypothetical protein